jgi:alpha-ribazole phosphatase
MIVFLRHGETERNREGRLQGRSDAPLTERGREQIERVARVLAREQPARIVASPLPRTVETALIVSAACGDLPVEHHDDLIELDYGAWEGRRLDDVPAQDWQRWQAEPTFAPPGGESLVAVRERVGRFCAEFGSADGSTIAVSHVSPIKAAVAWALDAPLGMEWRTRLAVASLTRIECRPTPVLVSFNEQVGAA